MDFMMALLLVLFLLSQQQVASFTVLTQIRTNLPLLRSSYLELFLTEKRRRKFLGQIHPPKSIGKDFLVPSFNNKKTSIYMESIAADTSKFTKGQISKIEKFARYPMWPVWNGVLIFLISKVFGDAIGAKVEDAIGGRVCPNFYNPSLTSPFVMLVHHRHSFASFDPLRFIQKSFFPEGFPAHPHRGFITVTYILSGGLVHRDSMGVKQVYGAEKQHGGKHTQWLMTGAGVLHEEMWDIKPDGGGRNGFLDFFQPSSQELYQLWLNVPANFKMNSPTVELLGGDDETPTVIEEGGIVLTSEDITTTTPERKITRTTIVAGVHADHWGTVATFSDIAILHVRMDAGSIWKHKLPSSHKTSLIYMRRGSATIDDEPIPVHYTAYLESSGTELVVEADTKDGADFLFLAGRPLDEPFQAQGSIVMNYPDEIDRAYGDYQMLKMGAPWEHDMNDEDWKKHVEKHPSIYK